MSNSRIKLLSGGFFDFIDIENSTYTVEDIAHNLSHICRYTGAVEQFYSVAQHSVIVSHCVPPEHALSGLMHDASEAFMSDLNSPLKALMKPYKALEKKVEKEIFGRLNLPFPMKSSVKVADVAVFMAENRDLRGIHSEVGDIEAYDKRIVPWTAAKSKKEFLKRYNELTEKK
jgi:hypothetical protein